MKTAGVVHVVKLLWYEFYLIRSFCGYLELPIVNHCYHNRNLCGIFGVTSFEKNLIIKYNKSLRDFERIIAGFFRHDRNIGEKTKIINSIVTIITPTGIFFPVRWNRHWINITMFLIITKCLFLKTKIDIYSLM